MNLKRMTMAAVLMVLYLLAEAKVTPIVHYNFGKSGNVTYAVAPEKLTPLAGKGELMAVGRPVFYADAPGDKKMKGEGGILFNGNGDGYKQAEAIGSPADNQVLEIWVKPRQHTQGEGLEQVLLSNGTTKEGYVFTHQKGHWYLISGGTGRAEIGEVSNNAWTHLAMVVEDGKGSVWMNGKKTGTFKPTKAVAPHFSIAVSEEGKEAFYGEIYEVRYSTFAAGKFNPESDFLLVIKR